MGKRRIYQAAKQYGLTSTTFINLLRDLGFEVKSHMSTMLDDMESAVKKKFDEERESARKQEEQKQQFSKKKSIKKQNDKKRKKKEKN